MWRKMRVISEKMRVEENTIKTRRLGGGEK
jgi:hypothetical protein